MDFITKGIGTSKPGTGSTPYIGKIGEMYHEEEDKIEMPCSKESLENVIDAIRKVHPYEVPIIEVIETDVYFK